MVEKSSRTLLAAAVATALSAVPLAAPAQTGTFYTPPKVVKQGAATTPIAGSGAVTVQVFIHKDGSIGAVKVEKSTNHGDDAAALEIAKSSTYRPGLRDAKPIDAYYTMELKFNGSSVVNDTGTNSTELVQANALIRANKFAEAKTIVTGYLSAHPGDASANALLGVADSYLEDYPASAAAFDAAGSIPPNFRAVAAQAYSKAALAALTAKNNDQAIAYADKALALQPNVNTLYIQGTAYANAQKYPQAIAALEKAKAQAVAGHAQSDTLNAIDSSLATTYVLGGQPDKGMALARELKARDPSNTRVDEALGAYYNQQAIAAMQAGKTDEAVTDLERGAQAVPSRAATMYVQAANILSQATKPDWKRVKAEADKALAVDGNNARANYVAAVALANSGDGKSAIPLLQKAKANAGSDASLSTDIDAALKKLQKQ